MVKQRRPSQKCTGTKGELRPSIELRGKQQWAKQEQRMHYQEVITGCVAFSRKSEKEDRMSHEVRWNAVRDVVSELRTTNEEIGTHYTRLWYSSFEEK
jgi:hypothetical protein